MWPAEDNSLSNARVRLWRLFILGRTVVTGLLLFLLGLVNVFYIPKNFAPLFIVSVIQFVINAAYYYLWKRRDLPLLGYICFTAEIVLITLQVLNFGADGYVFVLAYLWPIVMAGQLIGSSAILPFTLLSTLSFTTIILLQYNGLVYHEKILMPNGTSQALVLSLPYLAFTALLVWVLVREVQRTYDRIAEQNRALLAMNHLLSSILRSMTEGVFLLDREGRVTLCNRAASDLLNLQEGKSLPPALAEHLQPALAVPQIPERLQFPYAGRTISLSLVHIPADGAQEQILGVARDVTREAEVEQMKSDFLAYATHELRTPLTTIKTLVSLLRYTPLDAKAREYLDLLDAQVERQRRMITNLLDLARLEAGRYELPIEDVDLAQVLRLAARGLQPLAEGKGLSLTLHLEALPARIPSNASGLEQVFVNLIHNAIQFTDEGGVTIAGGQDEGTVWVTVEDTGIGMTPEQREHLFTKFYPMRAQAKRGEGTGLGLVISRMIVEALGGRIEVESTPGKGSRFTVRLPLHGAPSG